MSDRFGLCSDGNALERGQRRQAAGARPASDRSVSQNSENAKLDVAAVAEKFDQRQAGLINVGTFVAPKRITKSEAIKRLVLIAKRAGLEYEDFRYVTRRAREQLGLKRRTKSRKLPRLFTDEERRRFFAAVDASSDLQHQLLLRILDSTGVRVSELANMKRGDVDLGRCSIRIVQGKGGKDRVILFPGGLKLALAAYMKATASNTYLFETRCRGPFTTRRIQQIVAKYGRAAELEFRVYPHLFRHQVLTELTRAGLSDAQIQVLSGHASKRALEVYQHLGLSSVTADYQRAAKERQL